MRLNDEHKTGNPIAPYDFVFEREFFIDTILVRNHFIIVMITWTGLAPWESEFSFPGNLASTFLIWP